jgi:hypothetical protein
MAVTTKLYYSNFIPAFSNIGVPVPSSYLYFYLTGGTTLAAIYSDAAGTVPLTNPVQANLAGKFVNVYLDAAITYRVRQTDSAGVPLGNDVDPYIPGTTSAGVNDGVYPTGWSGDTTTAPSRNATYNILNTLISVIPVYIGDSGSGGVKGLVKAPASGDAAAGKYLKADGTWTTPPGGGAGTTTNAVTFNNGGSGVASGGTFNGSTAVTVSYNTIGAAPLASPAFTGNPTAPTPSVGDNDTSIATTAFVQGEKASVIQVVASAATVTPTFTNDQVNITALAVACQLLNPTGTAVEKGIVVRVKDNGTPRAFTYDTQYRAVGVTLPTTTVASKTLYLGMIYNSTDTKWDVVAVAQE